MARFDCKTWQTLEDHTRDAVSGSPLVGEKSVTVRYLRLVFPEDVKGSNIGIFE